MAAHGHARSGARALALALVLVLGFAAVELVAGLLAGSLALLADAGHMLADFAALALAWLGFRLKRRPADWRRTYGFDRFSVLVAFVNADPSRAAVIGFEDPEGGGFVPSQLDLARADGRVLCEGDTLTLTGVQAGASATGVIATVTLGLGVPPEPSRVRA